jgi:hypothetical protein
MLQLVLSSWSTYLFLAWFMILVLCSVSARPEKRRSAEIEQRFTWKWLASVPAELRFPIRKGARRPGFNRNLLASCAAGYARISEGIKRIRFEV